MYKGLPSACQDRITSFYADPNITLDEFIPMVENVRHRNPESHFEHTVFKVKENPGTPETASVSDHSLKPNHQGSEEINKIKEQLEELTSKLEVLTKKRTSETTPRGNPRRNWCPYCRMDNHSVRECRKKPPLGSCFDCWGLGCRRGQPGCPGRKQ